MSLAAEKIAEVLALPEEDRASLAHQLIASLEPIPDPGAEEDWQRVIERRSQEMEQGRVGPQSTDALIADIRAKLHASRKTPGS